MKNIAIMYGIEEIIFVLNLKIPIVWYCNHSNSNYTVIPPLKMFLKDNVEKSSFVFVKTLKPFP